MLKILHKKEKYTTKCIVNFLSIRYNLIMDIKYYEVLSRIGFFIQLYKFRINDWNLRTSKNFKNFYVCDFLKDDEFQMFTIEYLNKFNTTIKNIDLNIYGVSFSCRVKNLNSIYCKINRDNEKHSGKIPIYKCLNDLLGIRLIIDDSFDYEELMKLIKKAFKGYRFLDASKNGYIANHLYIKVDNFSFPFEIQFWKKENEIRNKELHKIYKQSYIYIENSMKEKEVKDDV